MPNDQAWRARTRVVLDLMRATGPGAPSLETKVGQVQGLRADTQLSRGLDQALIEEVLRLHEGLGQAQRNLRKMQQVIDSLTAPPQFPAVYLDVADGAPRTAMVMQANATRVVALADDVNVDALGVGDEVLLSHELNVILARSPFSTNRSGEVAAFDRYTSDGRAVLRSRDEEFVVRLAGTLNGSLRNGDHVLWRRDLQLGLEKVERGRDHELFVETTPRESFAQVGGLEQQIERIKNFLGLHVFNAAVAQSYGLEPKRGMLLYGPPGTGKTLMARAVANWLGTVASAKRARFINVKPGQLNSMWYGETERNIREVFRVARDASEQEPEVPVVIYFDEIDAIGSARAEMQHSVEARVLNALMAELDGFESRGNVVVLAATNRLDALDEALVRPGRLGDERIEIPRPNRAAARQILEKHLPAWIPYAATHPQPERTADVCDAAGVPETGQAVAWRDELIDTCISRLYAPNGTAELATLVLRDGKRRPVFARELVNGAILAKLGADARFAASQREIATGNRGVRLDDVLAAVSEQLESLAEGLTPRNAHHVLTDLSHDIGVVDVQRPPRNTSPRTYRYIQLN